MVLLFLHSFSSAQTQWHPQLLANMKAKSTVSVKNYCLAEHEFALSKSAEMSWFNFIREPRIRVAQGDMKSVEVALDTTNFDVGTYDGFISVHCADCNLEPGCKPENIEVRLKVMWAKAQLEKINPNEFVSQEILVALNAAKENQTKTTIKSLETKYGLRQIKSFELSSISRAVVSFQILNPNFSAIQMVEKIQEETDVLFAQPNFIYKTQTLIRPPPQATLTYSSAMKANYNDSLGSLQYAPLKIRADQVHKYSTGQGVKIAIIDTGIDYNHTDLKGSITSQANFVDDKSFAEDVHGTLVAGIIVAKPDNKFGIYGVAPNVNLIAIKSFKPRSKTGVDAEGTSQSLSQGLNYAITKAAQVINMSIGGPKEPLVQKLVQTAFSRGIVLVAAAGNDGQKGHPKYPAAYEQTIAVSATNSKDDIYWSATRGDYIDVVAPGVEIISTMPGNKFNPFTGTSMATPHVSAVVALLLQRNPKLSPKDIKFTLENTAKDLGWVSGKDYDYGFGLIDACKAYESIAGNIKICK